MIGEILKVDKCCEVRHDFMLAGLLQLMILTHNSTIIGVEVLIPILLGFSEHSTSTVIRFAFQMGIIKRICNELATKSIKD
jgi:hypothetical protein